MSTPTPSQSAPVTHTDQKSSALTRLWRRDAPTVVWGSIFIIIVLVSVVGPFVLQSPTAIDPVIRLQGPTTGHLLGTDSYGRDILARTVYAGRISLIIGLSITAMAVVAGVVLGAIAGYYHRTSGVIMRVMDGVMAFPPIVLAIALLVALRSGAWGEILALGIVFAPYVARVVRSRVISLREKVYVTAARSSGVAGTKILLKHILPNSASAILVQGVFVYANALLADSTLSFFGLGVAPPTPTWGNMIGEARTYITVAPTFIIFPGIAIILSVMALNLVGEGVRGIVDPHARAILELEKDRREKARRQRTQPQRGSRASAGEHSYIDPATQLDQATQPHRMSSGVGNGN